MESCIGEDLPPTTELEQALRNGVILCKLGHYCDPEALPLKRIYDLDEAKYMVGPYNNRTVTVSAKLEYPGFVGSNNVLRNVYNVILLVVSKWLTTINHNFL